MQTKRYFLKALIIGLASLTATSACFAESSLWKAASGKGTLYIQGSVHLLKADDYPLAPAIEQAYSNSQAVVFEADMKEMLAPETQQMIMQKAMLKGDMTLEKSLSPEVYAELSKLLNEAGLPPLALQKFKPWFVALTVVMTKMQAMGFNPQLGLDQYFYGKAVADGKDVIGLETAEFQINLFDSLAEGNQDAYMKRMFKELDLFESQLNQIMTAWKTGDIEALGKLMLESFDEYPGLYERFVVERNKSWAKKIETLVSKDTNHMIVVGAAHLPGKKGLLKLLEKQGYTLEQL